MRPAARHVLAIISVVVLFALGGATARAAGTIRIGAVFSESGGFSSVGSPGLDGMRLATAQINKRGGVLGRRLDLIAADSRSTRGTAARAVRGLIRGRGVVAIGGLNDSTLALGAGPVAQRAGIPFVTSGATLPSLPKRIGNDFFMAAYGDDAQAHAVAQLARDNLHAGSAFVLEDRGADFTRALARFFSQGFLQRGGTIAGSLSYPSGTRDFSAEMAAIRSQSPRPDVLFFSGLPSEAGRLVRQARSSGLTQPILSGDGFDTPLIGRRAGALADDVFYSTHVALDARAPRIRRFVAAYRKRYGHRPESAFAALGYDTGRLLADAIRRARSDDPDAIRRALAATRHFPMVTGTLSYAPGRRTPVKPVTIVRVQNGRPQLFRTVTPR
jgi:branched-chain amino acid transport system substrate-binding protein